MDPYWRSTRAIIVHRDDNNGYGLTVSGDNPVSVQTIKRGGAAELAGIRQGDIIIKVNGALVEHMNHTEVVELIRSAGAYVTLTVRPADMTSMPGMVGGNGAARAHSMHSPHERVTAPLPANHDAQMKMQGCKWRTLQAMRDETAADAEKLWEKYKLSQNSRDLLDFEKAKQRLDDIQCNMKAFRQSSPNLQLHSPAPFNPNPSSHQSVAFQPHQQFIHGGGGSGRSLSSSNSSAAASPGQRNRNPLSVQSVISGYPSHRSSWEHSDVPPPLPPRSFSQSFSSSDHPFVNPPGYSIHDPFGLDIGQPVNLNSTNSQSFGMGQKSYHAPTNSDMVNNKSSHIAMNSQNSHSQQLPQTHHRTKSSPDPVSMQKALNAAEASRRSDSVSDLTKNNHSRSRGSGAWDGVDNRLSPPGSPPPPYGKHDPESGVFIEENHAYNNVNFSTSDFSPTKSLVGALTNRPNQISAVDIISMEEDDGLISRDTGLNSSFGHYSSLSKLLEHNAHLAVFLNYVIDNRCDPSSLLFYLITGLYINEGNIKEMKRWAYEIHSTFTAPGSPLLVPHVDENIAKEIDDGLVHESDKEEMMRRVFRKARNKAKEEINKQLEEFSNKRTAGLGSMFGPPDSQLEDSLNDKVKEQRIVETYLLPRLEHLYEEWEKSLDDRTLAILNAGATVVQKQFGVRSSSANSMVEKCSSFVSKEKSMRHKLLSKNKKVSFNGHHFIPQYFFSYTECNICCKLLWGVGPQGLQCLDCNVNIHRNCLSQMQDNCVGIHKKDKANEKFRRLKEKIRPDRDPKRRVSSNWSIKKWPDDSLSLSTSISSADIEIGDRPLSGSGLSGSSVKGNDRRPDTLNEEHLTNDGFTCEDGDLERVQQEPRRSSNAVGRSESCKERVVHKKPTRERRKHSDPNLTSKSSDVDLDNQRHLSDANNSGSSSNSSLSARSLDSPSTSLELVGPSCQSSSSLPGRSSDTPETTVGHSGVPDSLKPAPGWAEGDSDIEIDQDPPDWTKNVSDEVLGRLDRLGKKRQEVLNELFHTERSHVRNLKVIDRLFHRPIRQQNLVPQDVIKMLFANLEELLQVHEQFNTALKNKRKESPLVGDIGPVLLEMFDGESGEVFKSTAAYFCAKQQIGLELLKEKRRKDPKFHAFLLDAESDPVCRRLQISDMIPMAMQRLTKYPLLFENLCNCTPSGTEENKNIQRAVEMSKEILNSVNHAKKEAEDRQRLIEIQRRLDKSSLEKGIDKADPTVINELRNLDFTKYKLIYEGPLSWRMTKGSKQKSDFHDVQAVLLDDMVVLLLRENEKFILKIHYLNFAGKTDRVVARPIIKLHNLLHRPAAADKKAFFLLNTTSSNMNMYELWCSSTEERKIWLQHITKAADDYKNRQQESRREINPNPHIPSIVPEPDDKTSKDVGEIGEAPGDGSGDAEQQQHGSGLESSGASPNKDASPAPDPSSTNLTTSPNAENPVSPESSKNVPEELKRVDSSIGKLFDEKHKLVSKILPVPLPTPTPEEVISVVDLSTVDAGPPKDAKDLVVTALQQVDQLGRILAGQKMTNDNLSMHKDTSTIQRNLSSILSQLLSEVQRRDEDSEIRRQELHRLRELSHGYEERLQLQARTKAAESQLSPSQICSPTTLSPSHSRPASFLSVSSSSDHHDDESEVVVKTPLKAQLSAPVASCSSNRTSSQLTSSIYSSTAADTSSVPLPFDTSGSDPSQIIAACDLAPEEFADAEECKLNMKPAEDEKQSTEQLTDGSKEMMMIAEPQLVSAALNTENLSGMPESKVPEDVKTAIESAKEEIVNINGHGRNGLTSSLENEDTRPVIPAGNNTSELLVEPNSFKALPKLDIIGECDEVNITSSLVEQDSGNGNQVSTQE